MKTTVRLFAYVLVAAAPASAQEAGTDEPTSTTTTTTPSSTTTTISTPSSTTMVQTQPMRDESYEEPSTYSYGWRERRLPSQIGIGVAIGGGVSGFTEEAMRDLVSTEVGGLWNLRVSIGTHIPLGVDLTYVGTAANVETFDGLDNGTLVGTTAEAALRWNILPHALLDPYVFGGIGWQRYDMTDSNFSQADTGLSDQDDSVEFPMGAGLAYRDPSGATVELRGTFRAVPESESDLFIDSAGNNTALHTWEASAGVGYEF